MGDRNRVVAVTGATGRQGGAVARNLLADGWRVRALTRKPGSGRARALAAAGAEVVAADMDAPETLLPALRGVHGVFSVQNPRIAGEEGEVRQGRNVADAAMRAGVAHVVYGSAGLGVTGTGVGSWDSKLEVETHMRRLGLPVTVLRPMAFMELMTHKDFYPAVSTWHVMPKLMGEDRPVAWLAVDDLGAIAARAFADPKRFLGAELSLAADLRSIGECRGLWRSMNGKVPQRFPMPTWMFERVAGSDLTTMWRWLRTAHLDVDLQATRELLPTALTVRDWLFQQLGRRRPSPSPRGG